MGCTASVASSPSTTAVPEPEVPSAEYFAQELMAAPSKSLDDEQVALINDNKSVQLPKGAAGFVPGDTAKLKGMKTESLNGKTVTLIEWKDKQGRWKVQAEGEKNTIDVLPEKLMRRRRSFTEQLIGLAAPAVRKLSISGESSGGGQPTKIEPMSAEDVAKQAQAELNDQANREKRDVLANAWVRRQSLDMEMTAEQLAQEQATVLPELARIDDEKFTQSAEFMERLEKAEARDREQAERLAKVGKSGEFDGL